MQCIAYLETRTKRKNGQAFKKKKSMTCQVGTVIHQTEEEAKANGWHRCQGNLQIKFEHNHGYGCGCCGESPSLDIVVTCDSCTFEGSEWALFKDNPADREYYMHCPDIKEMITEALREKYL